VEVEVEVKMKMEVVRGCIWRSTVCEHHSTPFFCKVDCQLNSGKFEGHMRMQRESRCVEDGGWGGGG
jgi:hypothetical protein